VPGKFVHTWIRNNYNTDYMSIYPLINSQFKHCVQEKF
jgi:hypothetical protein